MFFTNNQGSLLQVNVITLSLQINLKFPSSAPRHNLSILRCMNVDEHFHTHDTILNQSIKFSYAKETCISIACAGLR
jgi:hypothetical protein